MNSPKDKGGDVSAYSDEVRRGKVALAMNAAITKPLTDAQRFEHDPHAEDKPPTWKQNVADSLVVLVIIGLVAVGLVKGCTS